MSLNRSRFAQNRASKVGASSSFGDVAVPTGRSGAAQALADFRALAAREQAEIDAFTASLPNASVVQVPMLGRDVHDLDGLTTIADLLFANVPPAPG